MKQDKVKYDFKAFGQAIKEAKRAKGILRNQLADRLNIAPRYIASIENSGQHPSLQIFYELATFLDVSVDQFFFPNVETEKSTGRRQLDSLPADMSNRDLTIITATAKVIQEAHSKETFAVGGARDRKAFLREKVSFPCPVKTAPVKPHDTRLPLPLLRDMRA